jgi:O-antigen/teichoic acid export membrane protein
MGTIFIRDVARQPEKAGKYLTATLFLQTVLALVAYVLVNGAASITGYPALVQAYLSVAAVSLLIDILGSMCNDLLLAQERMAASAVVSIAHIVVLIALAGLALAAGYGLLGVYVATILGGLARTAALWVLVVRGGVRPVFPLDWSIARPLLLNGAPLAISAFLSLAYQHADKLMTTRLIGTTETGYLTAAFVIIFGVVELLNTTLLIAIYPMMSRYYGQGETFGFMVEKLSFFTLVISLPLALTLSLFADTVIVPLFGADFQPTANVLRVLIWYAVASMTGNIFAQGLMVQNRQRRLLGVRASGLGVNIVLNALLIPRVGIVGAALASLCAELLVLTVLSGTFRADGWDGRRLRPYVLRLSVGGVIAAVVMAALNGLPILGIVVGLTVYALGLTRVLGGDDWDLLYRIVAAMPGGTLVRRYWRRETVVNW